MIGIDTNILVRYLTQDDTEQAQISGQIFDSYAASHNSLFINNTVMCELIWVLEKGYKQIDLAMSIKYLKIFMENLLIIWLNCNYSFFKNARVAKKTDLE